MTQTYADLEKERNSLRNKLLRLSIDNPAGWFVYDAKGQSILILRKKDEAETYVARGYVVKPFIMLPEP